MMHSSFHILLRHGRWLLLRRHRVRLRRRLRWLQPSSSVAWQWRGFYVAGAGWVREMVWRAGENERRVGGEIWGNVVGIGVVRMTGGAHTRNPTLLEALARLIRTLS
jgi:hypothetical protein